MSTPTEIREALAAALEPLRAEVADLQVGAYQNWAPTPPSVDVYPGSPFQTGQGMAPEKTFYFTVRARASSANWQAGQKVLDRLMDPSGPASVEAALHTDQTLGGVVDSLSVEDDYPTGYGFYTDPSGGGSDLPGVEWRVRVLT